MADFDFAFEPKFKHEDWTDNQSRVQAAGPDGFNQRFHALENDLQAIGEVIDDVRAAVTQLATKPPPRKEVMTITPTLVNIAGSTATAPGWAYASGATEKKQGETADGMMSVSLPNGAKLTDFGAIVRNRSGNLTVVLNREELPVDAITPTSTEPIATVNPPVSDLFNQSVPVPESLAVVDNSHFKHFIEATLDGSHAVVTLVAFQIAYEIA
jgi:hypothetical protein